MVTEKVKNLTGARLAGGLPSRGREEHDFYATNPRAVEILLRTGLFSDTQYVLEPCVGMGHIANVLLDAGMDVTACDIVDRGFDGTVVTDFLSIPKQPRFDAVITNPPFSHAVEFIEQSLNSVKEDGLVAMFLKLAFLETQSRKVFFTKYPPKYVYVFSERMNTFRGGQEVDENGKPWSTTMATAWFIWQKGYSAEPIIRWL